MRTSLSRTVIKAALPGVPDYYQGSELWDLSLVDPDNRRPVDWRKHRELLGEIASADPGELVSTWRDGRIKLLVTQKTLAARRRNAPALVRGAYVPVSAGGRSARRVVAFARVAPGERALVACAGRFFARGEADFEDTRLLLPRELPSGTYECVITRRRFELARDGSLDVSELFAVLPCSLLEQVA
jgi:(1->4)-alpha-D-glucan 1-alpha-D-glucosylmutase